jgi:hypothetical protein
MKEDVMGEPALRLVLPGDDDGQVAPWAAVAGRPATWPATGGDDSQVAPATSAATAGATTPATNGATTAGTEPAGAPPAAEAVQDDSPGALELEPYGRAMSPAERAARLGRHWLAMARADVTRPGGLWHAVTHGKPESLAELHTYTTSRAWVPEGHEGALVPAVGAAYGHTVAKAGAALGLFICWVTARMLRLTLFLLVTGVITGLIIWFA